MRIAGARSCNRCVSVRLVTFALALPLALVLFFSPFATCGPRAQAAQSTCAAARELQRLKRLDAAEASYLEALKTPAGVKCAARGLEHLAGVPKKPRIGFCVRALALAEAGQKEKAEAAYVGILETKPGSECAKEGLKKLKGGEDTWGWLTTAAKNITSLFVVLGLALVAVLLLLQVAVWALTAIPGLRNRKPVRLLVRSGLEVNSLDDGWMAQRMGPQVASLVREQITPKHGGPKVVTGYSELSDNLKPLGEISSEAKALVTVATFLASIRRRERFEVIGALEPSGDNGPGVSVELVCEKSHLASTTLWGKDFGAPAGEAVAFQRLAVPAAGWIEHNIAKNLKTDDELLSKDPYSWALFKAGLAWQAKGESSKAVALYDRALRKDPENIGALINLSVIRMVARDYQEAEKLMGAALSLLRARPTRRRLVLATRPGSSHRRLLLVRSKMKRTADWYSAKYNIAALHINWADAQVDVTATDAERAVHREAAHRESRDLAERAVEQITYRWPLRVDPKIREVLADDILPSALLIFAGSTRNRTEVGKLTAPRDGRALQRRLSSGRLTAAGAMAYVAAHAKPSADLCFRFACAHAHRREFKKSRNRLYDAIEITNSKSERASIAKQALEDPAFDLLLAEPGKATRKLKATLRRFAAP